MRIMHIMVNLNWMVRTRRRAYRNDCTISSDESTGFALLLSKRSKKFADVFDHQRGIFQGREMAAIWCCAILLHIENEFKPTSWSGQH